MPGLSKYDQLKYQGKKQTKTELVVPESAIQKHADDYLAVHNIFNIRIPDSFWRWLSMQRSKHVAWIRRTFAGWADNTCFIPITNRYTLCMALELKAKAGKLHGKQKQRSKAMKWVISRSPEDTAREVNQFRRDAQMLNEILESCTIAELWEAHCCKGVDQ